jgi:N-acetylglucosamine-6-phosphate deacetylase
MHVIQAARILTAPGARWVAIDDGLIAEVGEGDPPSGATNLGDAVLCPGFIDVQINGIGDVDFSHCDVDAYARAEGMLLRCGVTTFLPTLISAPLETYASTLDCLAEAGAFGVHLEGPFLGGAPGAHRREVLIAAEHRWTSDAMDAHPGLIRFVTLAPEADQELLVTTLLAEAGVVVSLGHSTCSYADAIVATDAGATAVTHLFNGMAPLHHREPGLVGAALDESRLTPTLIADLVHVHPTALRLAIAHKRNVALVSDAIGIDAEWAQSRGVRKVDGAPRLEDGTLAGSVLTMDQAIRNIVRIGVSLERAVEMASTIPAELLGLDDRGTIAVGRRADLVALDPEELTVRSTWKAGVLT